MMEAAAAVASWPSVETECGVKAGREAAVLLLRAETWLPGRTWTGPWAGLGGVTEAEAAGPRSVCWGKAGVWDA